MLSVFSARTFSNQISLRTTLAMQQHIGRAQGDDVIAMKKERPEIQESSIIDKDEKEVGDWGAATVGENREEFKEGRGAECRELDLG